MCRWSEPAVFYASWNNFNLKNSIILTFCCLPSVFLAYCAFAYPETLKKAISNVFLSAVAQSAGMLPTYTYVGFHYFVTKDGVDFPTTHFTMSRAVFGLAVYAASQAPITYHCSLIAFSFM
ncbi:hypothetical protein PMAYCL1PPCAC_15150 [Pristionchus mayeri]|uniref:Uncharacterized protein n=1 Tax=Pristionchus mayeri TaxID=1317129 RepID=A0AAN5HXT9_9BILA|nr:hypothetical protein PMAYCL1PPCAC_15150 [Pristionchus mayeri]